jgi:phosphoglycerate dehydrogenase-like enzyme
MSTRPVVTVTFGPVDTAMKEVLGPDVDVRSVAGASDEERSAILAVSDVLFCWNFAREIGADEGPQLPARFVQLVSAGADHLPFSRLPAGASVASNVGAYAEPMAEHVLAMALAAAKRLLVEHRNLTRGEFNQFMPNKRLHGRTCGIFGFGGIGSATARLMRCMGMRIHAINRQGATDEKVDWIGTPDGLDDLVAAADVLIISAPLTSTTQRAIGKRQLSLMKDDAILINVARGEIVDEDALYEHLNAKPRFTACLDAWWVEPVRHGEFRMHRPFLRLPNVIGSPHNSASVADASAIALRHGLANCCRALRGEALLNLLKPDERIR